MRPTLRDVLALPAFTAAAVEVLTGDVDTTEVRWVHSSEVYEMGGLLAGGELLLTTGLGLYGRTAAQLTSYIDQIADAGCAALAMELGRSFFAIPPGMVDAAQRHGMALLALHAVVPFEQMVEDFHELLLRPLVARRPTEPIWQELTGIVLAGQGLGAVLEAVARRAGCGVAFFAPDGRRLAQAGDAPAGDGPAGVAGTRDATPTAPRVGVDVRGRGEPLGRLVLYGRRTAARTALAERAAVAVALELGQHADPAGRPSPAQSLIADLAAGVVFSAGDLAERLESAGLVVPSPPHVLIASVDVDARSRARDLVAAVREAVASSVGPCVAGSVGHHVVVVAHGWPRPSLPRVRRAFGQVLAALATGEHAASVRALAVAMPVSDLAEVGPAVAQAREVLRITRRMGARGGVHLARDVGVQRLLAAQPAPQLSGFVDEQLGSLIDYDRQRSADLVRTLDAFLTCGGNKARTAEQLGIRRQSLYGRLNRITRLLGVALDDPAQALCLSVAMLAWRLRTGLDPQAAFDRPVRAGA